MIILILFVLITVVETIFLWLQWDKISMALDLIEFSSKLIENNESINQLLIKTGFSKAKIFLIKLLIKFKKLVWIPITIILFINLIVSCIIGTMINLILMLL